MTSNRIKIAEQYSSSLTSRLYIHLLLHSHIAIVIYLFQQFDNIYNIKARRERAFLSRKMPLKIKKQIPVRGNLSIQDAVRKSHLNNERADDDLRTFEQREARVAFAHRYCLASKKTMTEKKEDTRLIDMLKRARFNGGQLLTLNNHYCCAECHHYIKFCDEF